MALLEVSALTKYYDDFLGLDKVSLSVKAGEIVGLLGPNGAGKTTTIQMLLGLTIPTSGTITYFGKEFFSNREYCLSRINYASAYVHMQGKLSVRQSLRIFAGLYGIDDSERRIVELSKLLHVEPLLDKLYWHLSSGQKTRVILTRSLLNKPKLLLMDEPTASLDPEVKSNVLELIRDMQKKEQVAILYTSHDMDEVTKICDRVIFLSKGRIVEEDTPANLMKKVGDTELQLEISGDAKVFKQLAGQRLVHMDGNKATITLKEDAVPGMLHNIIERGIKIQHIDIKKPKLEDVFLRIAKEGKLGDNK